MPEWQTGIRPDDDVNFFSLLSERKTYTVAWSVSERQERLILAVPSKEPLWNEVPGIGAPEFVRGLEMQIGKVDHHAGLQDHGLFAGGKPCFTGDYPDGGVDYGIQSVDLHDHRVEVGHLGIHGREICGIGRVYFSHEFRHALGMLAELD